MGRSEELRALFERTYAAHVHNAIQDVLLLDLVREIGALILDPDCRAASVRVAMKDLRRADILEELKADYRNVIPARIHGADSLSAEMTATVEEMLMESDLERDRIEFASLQARLPEVKRVLRGSISRHLSTARNKAVAHYEIQRDGADWKMWRVGVTGLTYGQLDEYIDVCTAAIELLSVFVLRESHNFDDTIPINQRYVDEYLDALSIGLRQQRLDEAERKARLLQDLDLPGM